MVDGLCRDHERAPEPRREANYFFRMTRHFPWLVRTLEERPDLIRPERYRNEVLGMLREDSGLEDLCISRPKSRLGWGIELPFDSDYVCYVWLDALVNYLTGIGFPDDPAWEGRWEAMEHLVGKDILKPHGVFWPTILHAAGIPVFRHLHVHGYWNVDARKISKSLGNVISPLVMKERYGFEPFRFYLLREMSYGLDAGFGEDAMVTRANADLSNALGNLVSRTLNMTARFADGAVPEPEATGDEEEAVREALARAAEEVDAAVRRVEPHRALEALFRAVAEANRYLDARAPWKAAKQPGQEGLVRTTLFTTCQALHGIALLLGPFLPEAAAEILRRLGAPEAARGARLPGAASDWGALAPGTPTSKGDPLFPRLEAPETAA
jgi:methionyl-tRNA synthetase